MGKRGSLRKKAMRKLVRDVGKKMGSMVFGVLSDGDELAPPFRKKPGRAARKITEVI